MIAIQIHGYMTMMHGYMTMMHGYVTMMHGYVKVHGCVDAVFIYDQVR